MSMSAKVIGVAILAAMALLLVIMSILGRHDINEISHVEMSRATLKSAAVLLLNLRLQPRAELRPLPPPRPPPPPPMWVPPSRQPTPAWRRVRSTQRSFVSPLKEPAASSMQATSGDMMPLRPTWGVLVPATADANGTRHAAPQVNGVIIVDSFLSMSCVTLVIGQGKHSAYRDLRRMSIFFKSIGANATYVRVASTHDSAHEGSAAVTACHDSLASRNTTDVLVSLPMFHAALLVVQRVPEPPGLSRAEAAVCVMVRGVAPEHLALWLAYHTAIGFSRAFVFVNEPWNTFVSRPGASVLARNGTTYIDWSRYPKRFPGCSSCHLAQTTAANVCHRRFRSWTRAVAIIDVDEFIFTRNMSIRSLLRSSSGGNKKRGDAAGGCLTLPCTWGVTSALPQFSLEALLAANVTTIGPLKVIEGDPFTQKRHKTYALTDELDIVAIHRPSPGREWVTDGNGVQIVRRIEEQHCPVMQPLSTSGDRDVAGFLHLISPSLSIPRVDALSVRQADVMRLDILNRPEAHYTHALRDAVAAAAAARQAAARRPAA